MKRIFLNESSKNEAIDTRTKHQYRRSGSLLIGFALAMITAGPAMAGPTGGNVVGGEATITGGVNLTEINQATNRVSINWDTFNVAANETVRFIQPSSTSVALNTIFDQNPSQIFGVIDANGRVLLINPNGMIFGPTSQVNVAGLVASSLNISTADFMAGNHSFESVAGAGGLVLNQGALQAAPGGFIALLGEAVANEGLIVADAGTIAMAAGSKVALDFDGSGLLYFAVESDVLNNALGADAAISNTGSLFADGGQVLLTASAAQDVYTNAINNEGLIRARRIDDAGGVVRLVGTGAPVIHSGAIDVSGGDQDSTGGTAELLGERVGIAAGASINADGITGGGTILVGGDVQGSGGVQTADFTYVGDGAVLSADALGNGDGGTVVVWAEEVARVYGDISARGGAAGGDGGFVETSGKSYLDFNGSVDASATSGAAGNWLLDPEDITITNANDNITQGGAGDPGPITFDPTVPDYVAGSGTTIDVADINTALGNGSNVTISTASAGTTTPGNITVDAAIAKVLDGGAIDGSTLTLIADNNIDVNQTISSTTGLLNVDLQANGIIDIDADITTNGGDFTANTPGITAFDSSGFAIDTTGAADAVGGDVWVVASGQITTGGITTSGGTATAAGQDAGFVALVGDVLDIGAITATGSAAVGATPGGAGGAVTLGDVDTPPTSITLNGDIDSSGGAGTPQGDGGEVQINGPSILAANRVINTGATAGNVIFEDAVVSLDGGQSLTVTAGTGAVTLAAAGQGAGIELTELNVTGAGINLGGNITTNTATGIVLNGATTLTADVTLDSSTNDGVVNLSNAAVTDDATPRALNIVAGGGQIDLDAVTVGSIDATTSGTVNVGGNVTTDGAGGIALQGAAIDLADTFGLVSNGQAISLTADTLTDGATSTINAGAGTVTLATLTAGNSVGVCAEGGIDGCAGNQGATEYDLNDYDITADNLQISTTTTGDITLLAATLGAGQTYDLALQNEAGGSITVAGNFSGQGLNVDSGTGAINLDADVTTNGGDAVFADTVTLGANLTVDTSGAPDGNANFQGAIESNNGNQALVVDAGTGGVVSLGDVGQGPTNSLTTLSVTGGTINLGGNITTTNNAGIVLAGTKNLTADVTMTTSDDTVNLASGEIVSENGTQGLTILAGGGTVSLDAVGQGGAANVLADLDVTGGTIELGGNITTNTATGIVLNGATTLTADVTLDSSTNDGVVNLSNAAVTDDATPRTLNIVAGGGQIDLDAVTVGSIDATTSGAINLGGDIDTNGALGIVLDGTKNLGADVTLTTTGNPVDLASGAVEGTQRLVVTAGGGTVSLGDVGQGGATALTSLDVTGGTINLGGDIDTTDALGIVLDGTKNLLANVVLTTSGNPVDLENGAIVSNDGTQGLTVAAGAGTVLLGDVGLGGASNQLAALTVSSSSQLNLNGDVTTSAGGTGIDLTGDSIVFANGVALVSNDNDITFVTDDLDTSLGAVTINADTATVALAPSNNTDTIEVCDALMGSCSNPETADANYDVGGIATVTAGQFQIGTGGHNGNITLNAAAPTYNLSLQNGFDRSITVAGAFSGLGLALDSGTGGINLNADIATNGGNAVFFDNVLLGGGAGISVTTTGGDADFQGAVNGGEALTVAAGAGAASLGGVGLGTELDSLSVTAGAINLRGDITTSGGVLLSGPKNLISNVTINSGGGGIDLANGAVTDNGAEDLVLNAGTGLINLGSVSADSIAATTSNNINVGGNITTVGATGISLQGSEIVIAGGFGLNSTQQPITLVADVLTADLTSAINAGTGSNGTVTLAPLTTTNTIAVCGEDAVNGCGAVAGTTAYDLSSYAITANDVQIGRGLQTGDITLGAGALTYGLSLQNSGLGSITVAGDFMGQGLTFDSGDGGIALNGNVASNGNDIVFSDDVTLGGPLTSVSTGGAAGNVEFLGSVAGASALNVNAGGSVALGDVGQVADGAALTLLSVAGTTIDLAGDITTSGNVTLSGAKNLSANVAIDSSAGDGDVDLSSGNVTNSASENLSIVSGAGAVTLANVDVNSLDVTTTGAATIGAVTNTADINVSANTITAGAALSGSNVSLSAAVGGIMLPQVTAGGTFTVQADGNIDDNGVLDVTGNATFDATGDVTLDQAGSTFGSVSLTAVNATVIESDATELAGANVTGALTVNSGGAISDSGTLTVGGAAVLDANGGAADIDLNDAASTFGSVSLTASNASITENDDTDLGVSTIDGSLSVTSGGNIDDSGTLLVGGLATLNAAGDITLNQPASSFGSLSIAASNATVTVNESMTVDGANVTNGLTLTAAGSITSTDDIQAGSLTTSSDGGQTLTGAVGSFSAVNTGSGDVSLTNDGDLTVATISQTGGSIFVGTSGSMTQTGGVTADNGTVSMSASGGAITMEAGTVTNSNGGDIDYFTTGSGDITVSTLLTCPDCNAGGATGNINVTAGGNIFGQAGQTHITGVNAVLDSAGDIGTPTDAIVFANMPNSGTVIDLIFVGKAYIDSGDFGFTASDLSAVSDAFAGTRESAASAQAAAQEDEEEVDWAAYSEDITVYEINNEGVQLPEVEEEDEFVKVEDDGMVVPIASND